MEKYLRTYYIYYYCYQNLQDILIPILQLTKVKHILFKSKFTQEIVEPGFELKNSLILELVKSFQLL